MDLKKVRITEIRLPFNARRSKKFKRVVIHELFFFLSFRLQKEAIDSGSSEKPCKKIRLWAHS